MEAIVIRYIVIAKILTILGLTRHSQRYENFGFIGSAVLYTFIIMLFHLFTEFLGINFDQDFSITDIFFKITINLLPALLYFWLLKLTGGIIYWIIFGGGLFYFLLITKYTVMT